MKKQALPSVLLIAAAMLAVPLPSQAIPFTIDGVGYDVAAASESLIADFRSASGATTAGQYSGLVLFNITGTGQSSGTFANDAFYLFGRGYPTPTHDANYYQVAVTTQSDPTLSVADDAYKRIVYDVTGGTEVTAAYTPAYRADHSYSFIVDTDLVAPSSLRLGVSDGNYGDNRGSYQVEVSQLRVSVPDAGSTVSLLALSFAGLVWFGRRRR